MALGQTRFDSISEGWYGDVASQTQIAQILPRVRSNGSGIFSILRYTLINLAGLRDVATWHRAQANDDVVFDEQRRSNRGVPCGGDKTRRLRSNFR